MPKLNPTESQILEMRAAVLYTISKICVLDICKPTDFLGRKYSFPVSVGSELGFYEIIVDRALLATYEKMVRKATKEMENRVLNGEPGSKPKGLLGSGNG